MNHLIYQQQAQKRLEEEIIEIQRRYERSKNPVLAKAIQTKLRLCNRLEFTDAPLFPVPELETLSRGIVQIGRSFITSEATESIVPIPVMLDKELISWGVLLTGQSGTGKTAAELFLISQIARITGMNVLGFFGEGNEERQIMALGIPMLLLDTTTYRFNLFDYMEGVDIELQASLICDVLGSVMWVFVKVRGFLMPILRDLLAEAAEGNPKDILDFYEAVKRQRPSEARLTVLNRLEILKGISFFHSKAKNNISILSTKNIAFLTHDLHPTAQAIFISILLLRLMRYKEMTGQGDKAIEERQLTVTALEECQTLLPPFSTSNEEKDSFAVYQMLTRGRKRGVCGILCLPNPASVDPKVLQVGTVATSIQATTDNLRAMQSVLNLTEEQKHYLSALEARKYLCRKRGISTVPMVLPDLPLHGAVSITREEWNGKILEQEPELKALFKTDEEKKKAKRETPDTDEAKFLKTVVENPWANTSEIYELLPWDTQKSNELRKKLIAANHLESIHAVLGRGKWHSVLKVTDSAINLFGLTPPRKTHGAGPLHDHLLHRLDHFTKKVVRWEPRVAGRIADLQLDDTIVELSISCSLPEEASGIEVFAEENKVLVLAVDEKRLEKLAVMLPAELRKNVTFSLFIDAL